VGKYAQFCKPPDLAPESCKITSVVPRQVTYFLSKPGEQLIPMMQDLCDWGSEHFGIEPTMRRPFDPTPGGVGTRIA
jgi:HxlR-like helix-turn-helix